VTTFLSRAPQKRTEPPSERNGPSNGSGNRARWWNRITITALVALVALIAGGANLVYMFWPDLRADPGLQHTAQIAVLKMDQNVPYSKYLRRPGSTASTRPPADPMTYGNVFYLQMQMEGFKGKRAKLRWFTYDADNGERLPRPFSTGHNFKQKAPTQRSISEEWVQLPQEAGRHRYWIRFELFDSGDVLLAFADSRPFRTVSF
jgi:hypothetical protein